MASEGSHGLYAALVEAPSAIRLPDGRTLAYDDVGDPDGPVVVYLHGTPDSRLGRPADHITASAGVRLLAVDRPGAGGSDADPAATLTSFGADLEALLDHVGVATAILVGWSGGGLAGLGAAVGPFGGRLAAIGLICALPPVEAYADPTVLAALGAGRRTLYEISREVPRGELAADVGPYLVPDPIDPELARAHVLEHAGDTGRAELAASPGAVEALTAGLLASVQRGREGLVADVARQLEPGLDLSRVVVPVRTFHGGRDEISPPEVGAWLAGHLPDAVLDLSPDAGHHFLFPRWRGILRALCRDAGMGEMRGSAEVGW